MDGGPSFASRRPAATGLPAFSLPPPDIPSTKYPASASLPTASNFGSSSGSSKNPVLSRLPSSASAQPVPLAPPKPPLPTVSGVLIPPSGVSNEGLSPLSSGVNTGSSMGSQSANTAGQAGANYSYMGGSWPTPQQPPASTATSYYNSGGNQNQVASPLLNQPFPNPRSMYQQVSPSASQFPQSAGRHQLPDGLPPPAPYHQSSPVFLTPISGLGGSGGGGNSGSHQIHGQGATQSQSTPTSSASPEASFRAQQQQHQQQQQQQQRQHQQYQQQQRQQQHQQESSQQQQQQQGVQYPYQRTTPQQSNYTAYPTTNTQQPLPSPTAHSPPATDMAAASHAVSRSLSISGQGGQMSGMAPPMGFPSGRQGMSFPTYQMPSPSGHIMTNMHQPGGPMVPMGGPNGMMSGGYNPGHSPHGPHGMHLYHHGNQSHAQHDRPFKCDQCTQSFNRNHDLKRHKKIHLAVKPFPCTFCDKAFSRKDALKRHRLVKGCGEKLRGEESNGSPPDRSDIMSDTTDGSPRVSKKEPTM